MVLVLVAATVAVGVAAGAAPMRLAGAQDQVQPPDDVDDALDDDDDDDDGGGGGDEPECGEALHYGHTTSVASNDERSLNHLQVADFNDDDHPDVAVAQKGGGARVWLNDGRDGDYAPSFTEAPHSPYAIGHELDDEEHPGLVVADFDGNGQPDLAATSNRGGAHGQGSVEVLVHSGDAAAPFSGEPTSYEVRPDDDNEDAAPRDLVAADVTGNGAIDLAVLNHVPANPNVGVVVALAGQGDGTFIEPDWDGDARAFVAQTDQRRMAAGDVDADGDDDLVTAARRGANDWDMVTVVENTDEGLKAVDSYQATGTDPVGLIISDFDTDGLADGAVAHSINDDDRDQLSLLPADGGGGFADDLEDRDGYYHHGDGADPWGITTADLDGGNRDLITPMTVDLEPRNAVWLWTGDGDGGFTWSASCKIGQADAGLPNDVVTADFVGNGQPTDVMVANGDDLVVLHPPPGALAGRVIEEAGVEGEADGLEGAEAVDEEMIEPLEGATVTAERVDGWFAWDPPVLKDATTDGEGFYPDEAPEDSSFGERWKPDEVVALVPGFYDVTADADGYRPETRERVEVVSWNPDGDPTVEDFALAPWGEISGTVKDAASEDDLDGVAVTVTSLDDELSEGEPETVGEATSAAGEFVVDELEPGEYRVTGELEGYESDSAEAVVRDETDYEASVELELEPKPGVIAGQVTDAGDGEPIAGAQVAVTSNDGGGGPVEGLTGGGGEGETGADGRYEVAGLEPGEYQVAADADGYESARLGPVDVDPGDIAEVNLALAPLSDDDPPDDDDPDDGGGDGGGGDPGGETGGDPGGEPGGETGGDSGGESAGESSGEAGGESAGESSGEAGGESAGETGGEASGEAGGESAGEAGGEPSGETGGESGAEPGGEPAGDSATEAGGEPAGDSAGESVGETGGESAGEVTAEPSVDAAGQPSIGQAPAGEPAPAAAEVGAEPAAAEPAGDPAMAPGESGVPGEAAAADQPQASGAGERVRQVAPPVETEGVPAGEETSWLATATTSSGQPPASAVMVWMAGVALAAAGGWAGRRRRAQPATPTCALARVPADPPAGPDGEDLDGHADDGEIAWIVRGLR